MKILASSDGTGVVKEIICQSGTDTSKKDGIKPQSLRNICTEPESSLKTRVIEMIVFNTYLITLRINGVVCIYDAKSEEYPLVHVFNLDNDENDNPISLVNYSDHNAIMVAFESGKIFIMDINDFKRQPIIVNSPTPKKIATFVEYHEQNGVFAYGGEENDVKLIKLFNDINETSFLDTKFTSEIIFTAKNVPNNHLDLRVPVSIKKIKFLDSDPESNSYKFITITKYGQLRIYDTSSNIRPIHDCKIGEKPLIQLVGAQNDDTVVISDTTNLIGKYSLTQFDSKATKINSAAAGQLVRSSVKLLGKYSEGGNTGATHAIYNYKDQLIGTGGLDRYARIFDLQSRKLIAKIYLGTQISSLIIIKNDDDKEKEQKPKLNKKKRALNKDRKGNDEDEDEDEDEEDADEIWKQLEAKPDNQTIPAKSLKKKSRKLV